jgi:hypothetical protein
MPFDKYSKQKVIISDQPLKKDEVTYTSRRVVFTSKGYHKIQG